MLLLSLSQTYFVFKSSNIVHNNMQEIDVSDHLSFRLARRAEQCYPETVDLYRHLHQIPEIGLQQYATSDFVRQQLTFIEGVEVLPQIQEVPTAVIASITPQEYQQSILLRCELDALPLEEESGLSFAAKQGLHHACGHDGHMAVMLSAISIISKERASLKKKVVFCFQPGEEGKQGAKRMFQYYPSLTEAVQHCFALHFNNSLPSGWATVDSGPVTALSNRFTLTIGGKSAHCLAPHAGIDANFIGCSLVAQIYSFTGMSIPPLEGSSLVIYRVEGGSNAAMVSNTFRIMGSIRTFSIESYQILKERISKLADGLCSSFGAKVTAEFKEGCYRPVVNSEQLVVRVRKCLSQGGQFKFGKSQKCFAGEDFCQFSQRRPSCYLSIGSGLPNSIDSTSGQSIYPAHSPKHKIDQKALEFGVKAWLAIVFS